MATAAGAAPFVSDFTDPAWTVNDGTTVTLTKTMATIGENQASSSPSITLSQSFMIPVSPTTLTFQILNLTTDPVQDKVTPAFFTAELLDASNNSLIVPAIAGSTDYYARDLTDQVPPNEATAPLPSVVTVNPSMSSTTPITVTLDISSLPANTLANLVFSVFPNGDTTQTNASIEISDVTINGGTGMPTIPEPAGIVLLSMGMLGLAGHFYTRRRAVSVSDRCKRP